MLPPLCGQGLEFFLAEHLLREAEYAFKPFLARNLRFDTARKTGSRQGLIRRTVN